MEYIYAALLIHKAGKKVDEETLKKVLESAGIKPEEAKIKAVVSSLEGINIEETLEKAATPVAVQAAPAEKKEEKKKPVEEEKKTEEEAAAGLSALFG